jgi:hypothetical protein
MVYSSGVGSVCSTGIFLIEGVTVEELLNRGLNYSFVNWIYYGFERI